MDKYEETSNNIRKSLFKFRKKHSPHVEYPSSPLIPRDDPSLLFTNSGMRIV